LLLYFFSFFFSAGSADPAAQVFKPKGCENRPRWPNLHPTRGSDGQALGAADLASRVCTPEASGSADLRLVGLHTRSLWGCSLARRSAPNAQGWADPALDVCWLGPWPGARGRPQHLGLATLMPGIDNLS
jgi:hypothetical protein